VIRSAAFLGEEPQGTMPHALVLVSGHGDGDARLRRGCGPGGSRVCLIDTLQDEKFEAVRVAEALRERLSAIRLDTPGRVAATSGGSFRKCGGSSICAASGTCA